MADQSRPATGYPAYPENNNRNGGHHQQSQATFSTAGTAYPYAAPPPQPYYNPHPYYSDPNAARRVTFLRRLLAILIAAVVITGTIVFIVWLVLRPRVPQFRVESVTLSNFNLSSQSSLITGNWDVHFRVLNPNQKMTLSYDRIQAYVYYESEGIAETSVPPFVQATRNETSVRATFAVLSAYIDPRSANEISADRARGSVEFNVRMLARVRFRAGAWRARRRLISVICSDLFVGVSNAGGGSLTGGPRSCRVGI